MTLPALQHCTASQLCAKFPADAGSSVEVPAEGGSESGTRSDWEYVGSVVKSCSLFNLSVFCRHFLSEISNRARVEPVERDPVFHVRQPSALIRSVVKGRKFSATQTQKTNNQKCPKCCMATDM